MGRPAPDLAHDRPAATTFVAMTPILPDDAPAERRVNREVIVVGGGFAGLAVAERLARADVEVLLIDRNNYHQFKPLNYQVATSQLGVSEVGHPLRGIFRRHSSVKVAVAEVVSVDPQARTVTLEDGTVCTARILVLGVGVDVDYFGTPGAAEHCYPMYTLADAQCLSRRLIGELDRVDSPLGMTSPLDVVIVGGGPTGVELAGAIAENLRVVVSAHYKDAIAQRVTVHLVDHGSALLKPFSQASHEYARRELEQLGVRLHFGTGVTRVTPAGVELSDGSTIDSETVVWAGGQRAPALIADSALPSGHGGRITVDRDLTVPGLDGVYALGDVALIPAGPGPAGATLPQLGSVAQQAGRHAAQNILADLAGRPRAPFVYRDKGIMAMIGRGAAVAEIGPKRRQMQGHVAFLAWLGVHVMLLPGAWQRAAAIGSWVTAYGTSLRPRRINVEPE